MMPREAGVLAAAGAFALDQISKNFLLYGFNFAAMSPGERVEVTAFFNLVMVWNRGISYGLFPTESPWGTLVLLVFSLAAATALGYWMWRAQSPVLAAGLGLIVGGALGNVIDRVLYGAVADFFHFHAFGYDWYVFNVADAAITVGVIVLLADAFVLPGTKDAEANDAGTNKESGSET